MERPSRADLPAPKATERRLQRVQERMQQSSHSPFPVPRSRSSALRHRSTLHARISLAEVPVIRRRPQLPRLEVVDGDRVQGHRSEEHTSELQSLIRISYDVFCLKKK